MASFDPISEDLTEVSIYDVAKAAGVPVSTVSRVLNLLTRDINETGLLDLYRTGPVRGVILSALPVIVVFPVFQRQIAKGITVGAVKG